MKRWRAASSPSSTRRRCAGSAARCRAPACWRADAVAKALTSLRRFRALCRIQKVGRVYAIATAACRDASNGPDFIAKAERICGAHDSNPVGAARGETVRARRRLRHPQSRRHRRRSRRRLARTDRRAWQPRPQRRDAAARKPGAAGSVAQIAEARRTHRQQRICPTWPSSRPAAAAPSMRSAAPGARWRASTSSRAAIRCG